MYPNDRHRTIKGRRNQIRILSNANLQEIFPIEDKLCRSHLESQTSNNNESTGSKSNDDMEVDLNYELPALDVQFEDIQRALDKLRRLISELNVSPSWYIIRNQCIDQLSERALQYHKQKYNEATSTFKEIYCESVVPGQDTALRSMITDSSESTDSDGDDKIPAHLKVLYDAYVNGDER
ncbi:unnamed protein product [Didymodactylos carnosus]|uniref:Uncharacterized protein n=1 Tax=Didymodactylos carnosus TaxID=1234261 RepID=A0A8S2E5Z0_9BILA|nr:unnamed protein product [Didymodactylos carnosus]CAF3939483.1 unnamed protein product [Didymodactylos carnosus]